MGNFNSRWFGWGNLGPLVRTSSSEIFRPTLSLRKMVLIGKTGTGKSSSGNTILSRRAFEAATDSSSVTHTCKKETGDVAGREVILVDTPGLFDTTLSETDLKLELSKCINMTAPEPHAFILVIQLGPFTREERQSVEKIRAIFGEEADQYTMILFTHGDELTCSIDDYVAHAQEDLKQIIQQCGGRYHVFDNTKDNRSQVLEFLDKVDNMVDSNGGECYINRVFQDAEKMVKEKEKELLKNVEDEKMKLMKEKRELEELIESLTESGEEKERKIKELELKNKTITKYNHYYKEKLTAARQEAEQTPVSEAFITVVLKKLNSLSI